MSVGTQSYRRNQQAQSISICHPNACWRTKLHSRTGQRANEPVYYFTDRLSMNVECHDDCNVVATRTAAKVML